MKEIEETPICRWDEGLLWGADLRLPRAKPSQPKTRRVRLEGKGLLACVGGLAFPCQVGDHDALECPLSLKPNQGVICSTVIFLTA